MRGSFGHGNRWVASISAGCAVVALAAMFAVPRAHAAALPTGHAKGVRVTFTKHTALFHFGRYTDLGVRYLTAGRRVRLSCTWLQEMQLDGYRPWFSWRRRLRAPRRPRVLRLHHEEPSTPSFCTVWQIHPVQRPLVDIPVTEDGAAYLDERRTMGALTNAAYVAATDAKDTGAAAFPTAEQLVGEYDRGNLGTVVALPAPDATPPPGKLGLFSDGAHHFEAVKLTTLGRRLFYDIDNDVLTTNGQTYLFANAAQ